MNALDQLNAYLRRVERRLRLLVFSRGAALTAVGALALTLLLATLLHWFGFSQAGLLVARVVLFLSLALAAAFGLVIPLLALNRARAARRAENEFPEFKQGLLTFAEKPQETGPFAHLLAADAMKVASTSDPERLASNTRVFGFLGSAGVAVAVLLWLILAGPGFLGYGTSLLWAGAGRSGGLPAVDIIVTPGDKTVRRKADQLVTAQLIGFDSRKVRLYAQYHGAAKWEEVAMQPAPRASSYEFLFGGLAESVEYYVDGGGAQSKHYTLRVIDLPSIKKVRVTYHYPGWSGMKDTVEDPGGDLRAVEGSQADVEIETDKPLAAGALVLGDDQQIQLAAGAGNRLTARVPINKDGMYHVAALEAGEQVRLSEDYFIEARKDSPPTVKIERPARDAKVNPIEEVGVSIQAEDDFGLNDVSLHYSVNGAPEKVVSVLSQKGAKKATGSGMIYLEDYKLSPGDIVSLYAVARDALHTTQTDLYFLEAQPYEREYSQSQEAGGEQQGGDDDVEISQRQKDIIAATWNELRKGKDAAAVREDARFISDLQGKLSAQAHSLADRMRSRQMTGANQQFQSFVKDMDEASAAMVQAVDKLKSMKWKDALAPEQTALQHILRAEATRREIQVAFGNNKGSGGGGMGRDMENMFDLELDTEKNQYETGQQSASDRRQKEIDKALERLKQLAQRQQELAKQNQNPQQISRQRWEQEMLRREAEDLKRQMEQLQRGEPSNQQQQQDGQQGQQGQSGQQGKPSSSGQSGGQQSQSREHSRQQQQQQQRAGQPQQQNDPRLKEALDRLAEAADDMRKAVSSQSSNGEQASAEKERASKHLQQARDLMDGMRNQEAGQQLGDMARQAERLAARQRDVEKRMRETYGQSLSGQASQSAAQGLASEKEKMAEDLKRLERQMTDASRQLTDTQPAASSKLRDALAQMQQDELGLKMKKGAEWLRQGQGMYTWVREPRLTNGVEKLRDQIREAQSAFDERGQSAKGPAPGKQDDLARALSRVEQMRQGMEQMAQAKGKSQGKGQGQGQQKGQKPSEQPSAEPGSQPGMRDSNEPGLGGGGSGGAESTRDAARELNRLRPSLQGVDGELGKDVGQLLQQFQRMNLAGASDAEMAERIRQLMPSLERIELELRRKLDEKQAGQVRAAGSERVPPGYADSIAEYFRKLSKGK